MLKYDVNQCAEALEQLMLDRLLDYFIKNKDELLQNYNNESDSNGTFSKQD